MTYVDFGQCRFCPGQNMSALGRILVRRAFDDGNKVGDSLRRNCGKPVSKH